MDDRLRSTEPAPAEIRDELARVLASPDFVSSDRVSQFLRFVVEETLEGHGDRIKERTVAINALGRDAEFDPRTDPAVRVTAGRLRHALDRYYAREGAANPLRIKIPKGSYRPAFQLAAERRSTVQRASASDEVTDSAKAADQPAAVLNRILPRACPGIIVVFASIALAATAILLSGSSVDGESRESRGFQQNVAATVNLIEQAGALPYRIRDGVVEVLLVRTLRDSHWTIPKATQKPDTAVWQTAAGEALREAGVHGSAQPSAIGNYFYARKGNWYRVTVYPLLVTEELSTWPEMSRQRQWGDIETACDLVASRDLRALVRRFAPENPSFIEGLSEQGDGHP